MIFTLSVVQYKSENESQFVGNNTSIIFFYQEVMVAGGMESMSNVPFMVSRDAPAYGGHKMEVGRVIKENY